MNLLSIWSSILIQKLVNEAPVLKYKIPLPLVSTDASTYNNMEIAIGNLYDWSVIPTFEKIYIHNQ